MIIIFEDELALVDNAIEIAEFEGFPSEKVLGFRSLNEFLAFAQTREGGIATIMSQVTHVFLDHNLVVGTPNGEEIYNILKDPSSGFTGEVFGIAGQSQPYLENWKIKNEFFTTHNLMKVFRDIASQKEGERITIK